MAEVNEDTVRTLVAQMAEVQQQVQNISNGIGTQIQRIDQTEHSIAALTVRMAGLQSAGGQQGSRTNFDYKGAAQVIPDMWDGKTAFRQWSLKVTNWIATLHPKGQQIIEMFSRWDPDEEEPDMNGEEDFGELERRLYSMLSAKTTGEPQELVTSAQRPKGFQAWVELSRFYDARDNNDALAAFEKLKSIKTAKDGSQAQFNLQMWLKDVRDYEARYEKIPDTYKMAMLKDIMPKEEFNQSIRGRGIKKFEDMLNTAKNYLRERPREQKKNGKGDDPMDIGEMATSSVGKTVEKTVEQYLDALIKGKGKGKGWGVPVSNWQGSWGKAGTGKQGGGKDHEGKGKGKGAGKGGKGDKGKGKGKGYQGECWRCGQIGHKQTECPSWWSGAYSMEGDDWAKAEEALAEEATEGENVDNEDEYMASLVEEHECVICDDNINIAWELCGCREGKPCEKEVENFPKLGKHISMKDNTHMQKGVSEANLHKDEAERKKTRPKRGKKVRWNTLDLLSSDDSNFYELNALPNTESKPSAQWTKHEAAVDSGAADSVAPVGVFSQFKLRPSKLSMQGKGYISATRHKVPNLGERGVEFTTEEGRQKKIMFQEADIGKILVSVDKLAACGNSVHLTRNNPHIRNEKTGEITKLKRKRGQFILEMWVKNPEPDFHRQGK